MVMSSLIREAGRGVLRAASPDCADRDASDFTEAFSGLAVLENIIASLYEPIGVLGSTVHPDLIVQVRPGGPSRRTHRADALAHRDALAWLARQEPARFDVAFVDPPFDADLWQPTLAALLPKLARNAWLYVESPPEQAPELPRDWTLHREGRTREVRYALYRAPDPRGADTLNGNISVVVPE